MPTFARIVNNQAVDVTTSDLTELFHEEVAAQFVEVPNGTQNGATLANGVWTAPPLPAPPPPPPAPVVSAAELMGLFTPSEEAAMIETADPVVKVIYARFNRALAAGAQVDLGAAAIKDSVAHLTTGATPILASQKRVEAILSNMQPTGI